MGELVEGTRFEPILDQAYYKIIGPRRVRTTLDDSTAQFDAWSSREFHGVQTLDKEKEITESFLRRLSENDVAWDIGANVGWHAVFMGQIATTVAFEPNIDTFRKLHRNVGLNPDSEVIPVCSGVSATDDSMVVETTEIGSGAGAAISMAPSFESRGNGLATVLSGAASDAVFSAPDAIKMDIQGVESVAIESLAGILDSVRLMMIETHEGRLVGDWTSEELDEFVQEFGFTVVDSDRRRDDVIRIYES